MKTAIKIRNVTQTFELGCKHERRGDGAVDEFGAVGEAHRAVEAELPEPRRQLARRDAQLPDTRRPTCNTNTLHTCREAVFSACRR